jgi:hypothetical protein
MAQERYIRCTISPGMFETEVYASVLGSSVYVDKSAVRITQPPRGDQEGQGEILAYVIEEGAGDKALVELPGQPVVGGLRTWVPKTAMTGA